MSDFVHIGYVSDMPHGYQFTWGSPMQSGPWMLQQDPWLYGQTNPWLNPWGQQPWWENPKSPWGSMTHTAGLEGVDPMQSAIVRGVPGVRRIGRMRAKLVTHGGTGAAIDLLDAMTARNVRALRSGNYQPLKVGAVRYVEEPTWKDIPAAQMDRAASAGTLAAARAAEYRVKGIAASVGLQDGLPVVVRRDGGKVVTEDPSKEFGRKPSVIPVAVSGSLDPTSGVTTSDILITIDDDHGSPVVDFSNKMARHNARQIREMGLPKLYDAGVHYSNENGELWLDAAGIVERGTDDCEGLAAYRAGELLLEGDNAGVLMRLIPSQAAAAMGGTSTGRLFHAVTGVRLPNGEIAVDDPSARLGMPVPEWYLDYARKRRMAGLDL